MGVVAVIALIAGLVIGYAVSPSPGALGGLVHNTQEIFTKGIQAGSPGVEVINSSGQFVGTVAGVINGTSFRLDSGTTINSLNCTSTSWNPGAVTSTTTATTSLTLTASLGDQVIVSFATSTQELALRADVNAANTILVNLFQPDADAASVNLATSTVKACVIGF